MFVYRVDIYRVTERYVKVVGFKEREREVYPWRIEKETNKRESNVAVIEPVASSHACVFVKSFIFFVNNDRKGTFYNSQASVDFLPT